MTPRRFPPPWSVDDPDIKLGQDCFIVRDANGQAPAYVYFKEELGGSARLSCGVPRLIYVKGGTFAFCFKKASRAALSGLSLL
jgi:hypothetical protein